MRLLKSIKYFFSDFINERRKHTLKICTLDNTWHDKDEVLLHAVFQILVNFIEKERVEIVDWEDDAKHAHAWHEMQDLYKWWKEVRPARVDPILELSDDKVPPLRFERIDENYHRLIMPIDDEWPEWRDAYNKSVELGFDWAEEDQRNLHRLVEIRGFLWV